MAELALAGRALDVYVLVAGCAGLIVLCLVIAYALLELARAGRYAEALGQRFLALVLELDRRKALRFHASKTPAEYVGEARLTDRGRASLAGLVAQLYRHLFAAVPCGSCAAGFGSRVPSPLKSANAVIVSLPGIGPTYENDAWPPEVVELPLVGIPKIPFAPDTEKRTRTGFTRLPNWSSTVTANGFAKAAPLSPFCPLPDPTNCVATSLVPFTFNTTAVKPAGASV